MTRAISLTTIVAMGLGLTFAACGGAVSSSTVVGMEGGPCLANGTCNAGLVCLNGLCAASADSGAPEPPSCAPGGMGMTNCGAGAESCCASLPVPGGTFQRTYTNTGSGPTAEADPATVSGFRLDKYEVTVGRFRQYANYMANGGAAPSGGSGKHTHLNAGKGLTNSAAPASFESGWNVDQTSSWNVYVTDMGADILCDPPHSYAAWTSTPGSNENLPMNCVNWYEAYAFCIWDGGFLPTEAEWEYAAAGGEQQREYPWGATPPGTGNQYAIFDCQYPSGSGPCSGVSNIARVGTASLGAGAWGHVDLDGNMAEWTLDYWSDALYVNPCSDCAFLTPEPEQGIYPFVAVRGSSFKDSSSPPIFLLPPSRNYATGAGHNEDIGFRCARMP